MSNFTKFIYWLSNFRGIKKIYYFFVIFDWKIKGKPVPPPGIIKKNTVSFFQKKYSISTLIETGTFKGWMVKEQLDNFKKIYSIELDKKLFIDAKKMFEKYSKVKIIQGDSGRILKKLVPLLNEKCVFWLDGHYSGEGTAKGKKETPIFEELRTILKSKYNHLVLIDDARCFNGKNDYPTLENLSSFVLKRNPNSKIEVKDDIIRIIL
jgi:hypothetical protein